jgi:hypothetical protein
LWPSFQRQESCRYAYVFRAPLHQNYCVISVKSISSLSAYLVWPDPPAHENISSLQIGGISLLPLYLLNQKSIAYSIFILIRIFYFASYFSSSVSNPGLIRSAFTISPDPVVLHLAPQFFKIAVAFTF